MGGLNYLGGGGAPAATMPGATPSFGGAPQMPGMGAMGPQGFAMPGQQQTPASMQWAAVTQSDGSVLLHMKLPDGSLGPVVKVISPPKPKGAGVI